MNDPYLPVKSSSSNETTTKGMVWELTGLVTGGVGGVTSITTLLLSSTFSSSPRKIFVKHFWFFCEENFSRKFGVKLLHYFEDVTSNFRQSHKVIVTMLGFDVL